MMDERDDLHDFPDGLSLPFPGAEGCGPPHTESNPVAQGDGDRPRSPHTEADSKGDTHG